MHSLRKLFSKKNEVTPFDGITESNHPKTSPVTPIDSNHLLNTAPSSAYSAPQAPAPAEDVEDFWDKRMTQLISKSQRDSRAFHQRNDQLMQGSIESAGIELDLQQADEWEKMSTAAAARSQQQSQAFKQATLHNPQSSASASVPAKRVHSEYAMRFRAAREKQMQMRRPTVMSQEQTPMQIEPAAASSNSATKESPSRKRLLATPSGSPKRLKNTSGRAVPTEDEIVLPGMVPTESPTRPITRAFSQLATDPNKVVSAATSAAAAQSSATEDSLAAQISALRQARRKHLVAFTPQSVAGKPHFKRNLFSLSEPAEANKEQQASIGEAGITKPSL